MNEHGMKYQNARRRVAALRVFYQHLGVYIIVNLGLFLINIFTSPEHLWFIWPLFGWGIGILLNTLRVFSGALGSNWEQKKINEIMKSK